MKKLSFSYDRFVQLVWVLLFFVFAVQYLFQMHPVEAILLAASHIAAGYPLATYLSRRLLPKAIKQRSIAKFVSVFVLFCVLFSIANIIVILSLGYLERIDVFPHSGYFDYIYGKGALVGSFLSGICAGILFCLGFCGLQFFEINLRMREELSPRLQMLQAQINPHFMFNVLNHVHVLIRKEPELADSLLLKYTDILRYLLYNGDKETVSIGQEVQFLKNFVDVEAVRWRGKLDIRCRWEVADREMEIPPLLFITFVENAFKHVSRSDTEKGYVNISLVQEDKTIRFEVENSNVDPAPAKNEGSGIGLANIKRRLDILFSGKYSLDIDSNDVFYSTKLTVNG